MKLHNSVTSNEILKSIEGIRFCSISFAIFRNMLEESLFNILVGILSQKILTLLNLGLGHVWQYCKTYQAHHCHSNFIFHIIKYYK